MSSVDLNRILDSLRMVSNLIFPSECFQVNVSKLMIRLNSGIFEFSTTVDET